MANNQQMSSALTASEMPTNIITEAMVTKTVQEVGRIPQSLQDMSNPYALAAHFTPYIQYLESLPVESIQFGQHILSVTDFLTLLAKNFPTITKDNLNTLPIEVLKPTLPLVEKIYQTASSVARSSC
jgi:hypothetical protein